MITEYDYASSVYDVCDEMNNKIFSFLLSLFTVMWLTQL